LFEQVQPLHLQHLSLILQNVVEQLDLLYLMMHHEMRYITLMYFLQWLLPMLKPKGSMNHYDSYCISTGKKPFHVLLESHSILILLCLRKIFTSLRSIVEFDKSEHACRIAVTERVNNG
jgi:hypothetical protein